MLLKGKKGETKGWVKKNKHAQNLVSLQIVAFYSESESFSTAKYLATRMQTPGESQAWIRFPWMKGGDPLSSNLIKGASEGSC